MLVATGHAMMGLSSPGDGPDCRGFVGGKGTGGGSAFDGSGAVWVKRLFHHKRTPSDTEVGSDMA